jgi:hypothetical protein
MSRIILCLFLLGIASCATRSTDRAVAPHSTRNTKIERFSGHWSVGPAYSYFTVEGESKPYWLDGMQLPESIHDKLRLQSSHPTYYDGPEVSLYLVLDGYLTDEPSVGLSKLNVQQVVSVSDPKKDFIMRRKSKSK